MKADLSKFQSDGSGATNGNGSGKAADSSASSPSFHLV